MPRIPKDHWWALGDKVNEIESALISMDMFCEDSLPKHVYAKELNRLSLTLNALKQKLENRYVFEYPTDESWRFVFALDIFRSSHDPRALQNIEDDE